MKLSRWLGAIMTMGLFLASTPLSVQAGPYHHPHGNAYGWHGKKHHGNDRPYKYCGRSGMGPHHPRYYAYHAGPPVAYVAPVAPIMGIPYSQPQPQPAVPGLSGNLNWNF